MSVIVVIHLIVKQILFQMSEEIELAKSDFNRLCRFCLVKQHDAIPIDLTPIFDSIAQNSSNHLIFRLIKTFGLQV